MNKSKVFVLVHDLAGQPVEATVEYIGGEQCKFRQLDYDDGLQRHVGHLEPGPCKLRIQGPKCTSEEHRDLDLVEGKGTDVGPLPERRRCGPLLAGGPHRVVSGASAAGFRER